MTPQQYSDYSSFVASRIKSPQDILNEATPHKLGVLHMAIGISGEIAELVEASTELEAIEEVGDIMFYAVGLVYEAGLMYNSIMPTEAEVKEAASSRSPQDSIIEIIVTGGGILNLAKKFAIYNQPLNRNKLEEQVKQLFILVMLQTMILQTELSKILQLNEDKLRKRYPSKYADSLAEARIDKSNYEINGDLQIEAEKALNKL
jgi:hypothetical protein